MACQGQHQRWDGEWEMYVHIYEPDDDAEADRELWRSPLVFLGWWQRREGWRREEWCIHIKVVLKIVLGSSHRSFLICANGAQPLPQPPRSMFFFGCVVRDLHAD